MAPFFTERENAPVLNRTRIAETVIAAVLVSIITTASVFFVVASKTDAIITTKIEGIVKVMDGMTARLDKHFDEDTEFRIHSEKRFSKMEVLLEKRNGD